MQDETQKFQQLAQRIDPQARLVKAWALAGGVSAEVTALEIERGDGTRQRMVARRHGDADFQANPNVAAHEFRLLDVLRAAGVAAPAPLYVEDSGAIFGRPVIVVEFIEGTTTLAPANRDDGLRRMAAALGQIHAVYETRGHELSFLPSAQTEAPALLHGDYWPGNVLWRGGELAAIIDWEDARLGDPLADIANARLEILWLFGAAAVETFTRAYPGRIDPRRLAYWDVQAAQSKLARMGGWGLDSSAEKRMREEARQFIAAAGG